MSMLTNNAQSQLNNLTDNVTDVVAKVKSTLQDICNINEDLLYRFTAINMSKFLRDMQLVDEMVQRGPYYRYKDNYDNITMLAIESIEFDWEMDLLTGGYNAEDHVVRINVLYVEQNRICRSTMITPAMLHNELMRYNAKKSHAKAFNDFFNTTASSMHCQLTNAITITKSDIVEKLKNNKTYIAYCSYIECTKTIDKLVERNDMSLLPL